MWKSFHCHILQQVNLEFNKQFEEYVNSLLKHHYCTYRRPDSEDVPQYGWDTHNPSTISPHSSASGTDMVYTATRLTCIMGSCVYPYVLYPCICILLAAVHFLLNSHPDSYGTGFSTGLLHHATPDRMWCAQYNTQPNKATWVLPVKQWNSGCQLTLKGMRSG